ncbi:MAG TPA: ABC transporter permease [Guyparkeria sp.]|nr:ABC transporter permease [Guyparkeria sp.]
MTEPVSTTRRHQQSVPPLQRRPLWKWLTSSHIWAPVTGIAALLLVWQLASGWLSAAILPPPADVASRLLEDLGSTMIWRDTGITLFNVLASFLLSMIGGVLLGLLAARADFLDRALHPLVVIVESAPTIAWLVLAILWLGQGGGPPILVGMSMALPLVFIATSHGLRQIDAGLLDMARVYRLSPLTRLRRILLPSLALTLAGTASAALSVGWRGVIMAEAFSASQGLGPSLWGSYLYGEINAVYAIILWIIFLGLVLEYGLIHPARRLIERRLRHD